MFHHLENDRPATLAEADAEFVQNVGAQRPEQAWILSDRDVWYPNPAYRGPAEPHPEDDEAWEQFAETGTFPDRRAAPAVNDFSDDIEF